MRSPLKEFAADHRYLLEVAARQAGIERPIAVNLDQYHGPLLKEARRKELLPIDGVLVRDWDPDNRRDQAGAQLGMRLYEIEGVRFAYVSFRHDENLNYWSHSFIAVDRRDYRRLYRIACRLRRACQPPSDPPILPQDQLDSLWKNTINYLDNRNLRRIKAYGGRAKRGLLLTGPPGNGKTMACRWIWEECRWRGWEWRLVTPDTYRQARNDTCDAAEAVRQLFTVERRGIIFFDDMDIALRDRDTVHETDEQAVFLGALDGLSVNEGVVFVFTTNCALDLIDKAFKRPGRIDLVLHFKEPDAGLRRRLMQRWHEEIRTSIDLNQAVASTDGYSFAEIEELKNLLVLHFLDCDSWDWAWALQQFEINRRELECQRRRLGFGQDGAHLFSTINGS